MPEKSLFQEIADKTPGATVKRTMRIMGPRMKPTGPRTGTHLDEVSRRAGDCFWRCAVEVAKVVYQKVDARYPNRVHDKAQADVHRLKMDSAKKILQENRNLIFEAVLPMFAVTDRHPGDDWTEADVHAHDYFVQNCFEVMVRT